MMKSLLSLILLLAFSTNALAYDFMVDGLCYDICSGGDSVIVTYESESLLQSYKSLKGDIVIPNQVSHEGKLYNVVGIGSSAFESCMSLTSVTIPSSVTQIGWYAFQGCIGLTSVTIPNSVTYIGQGAFSRCTGLVSVKFSDSLTKIDHYAFAGCTGLTSMTIPNSVIEIGGSAFSGCTGLISIKLSDSLTKIGNYAFDSCTGLASVTIPESVTDIGENAFESCSNLVSITVELTNTSFDSRENCNAIIETSANSLIVGCKHTKIPTSIETIGGRAFAGCTGLTSIIIPNSVLEIGQEAFSGCTGLTSIAIPNSVLVIGENAFESCIGLTSVKLSDSLTEISSYAFVGCTDLTSVTIPNSVLVIGENAFEGCTDLISIKFSDALTKIGNYAFKGCTSLSTVTIPDSMTEIGGRAFAGCTGLTSIIIPNSVLEIGQEAFSGCTGLTSIAIPNSVLVIGENAFEGCTSLASVIIPNSVIRIGQEAFSGCTSLKSVTIPNSVKIIDNGVFNNCINLESIVCWIKEPQYISTNNSAFNGVNRQTCKLLIPRGCIKSYNSASPWLYFKNKTETLSINIDDTEEVEQNPLLLRQKFQQYYNEGKYGKAIEIGELILAQEVYDTDSTHALLIEQLADCYYKVHSYIKAKEYYEVLDSIYAKIYEIDSCEVGFINTMLGNCCRETNDFASAEKYYSKAYNNYLSCNSPNVQTVVATMLFMIHCCRIDQNKLLEAVEPYLEYQSIIIDLMDHTRCFPDSSFWLGIYWSYELENLARILEYGDSLCNQNRYDEALKMYADGIVLYQMIKGNQSLEVAFMYERSARCYLIMQQYGKAKDFLNLSKELYWKSKFSKIDRYYYNAVGEMYPYWYDPFLDLSRNLDLDFGIYYASQSDFVTSYNNLRTSLIDIYHNSIRFFSNNTSEERSAYWEKYSNLYCGIYPYVVVMADKHKSSNDKSLNYSELYGDLYNKSALFAKGLLLTSDNEFSRIIYESGDSILISRYEELKNLRNVQGTLSTEQRQIVTQKATELENELIYFSKDYNEFMKNLELTWADVHGCLHPNDIAIEFLSFPKLGSDSIFYIALTLRLDYDGPQLVFLCDENELKAAAKKAYTSNELSQLIWGKLSKELDGVRNIYFSPSGMLHQVSIESMPHWEKKDSLMNQCYNIYRLTSTRELAIDRENIQPRTAAVYGDINYNTEVKLLPTSHTANDSSFLAENRGFDADSAGYRGKIWNPLKYTKEEIDSIFDILKNTEIMVDSMTVDAATETSFKDLTGKKKSIIHIATHGFCWSDSIASKYNMKNQLSFMIGENYEDKVMSRTGLLFSGANNCFADSVKIPNDKDDGVLTAREASSLDLRGLDLLVLSACQTGQGEIIGGEGVFGLQRGFKKAGAQAIIMSLWSVNDKATSEMMTKFYHYYFDEGMTKREAFLEAQKYIKDKYGNYKDEEQTIPTDKPHWAAFILLDALDNK